MIPLHRRLRWLGIKMWYEVPLTEAEKALLMDWRVNKALNSLVRQGLVKFEP